MRAEEGGNQPQRVLLVGGPKHAEFINLEAGQMEYEFTSAKSLSGYGERQRAWNYWPETATHRYRVDLPLSHALKLSPVRPHNCFTHESLWNTPFNGGFNLYALRTAEKELLEAQTACENAKETLQAKQQIVSDRNREITEFQNRYEALLELNHSMDERLRAVRTLLELVCVNLGQAVELTGYDYTGLKSPASRDRT